MAARHLRVSLWFFSACVIAAGCAAAGPSPKVIADPTQRIEFDGFSILPPRGEGWVVLDPAPQVDPKVMAVKAYFVKRLTEGATSPSRLHRLTAVVRTVEIGDLIGSRAHLLQSIAGRFSGVLDTCFRGECVRYENTTEDRSNPAFPGLVFVISKQGLVVLHPDSPTLAINVEYRQYHAQGVTPLSAEALEREVEPFQRSLEFTAVRPTAKPPTPAEWVSEMETGGKAADAQRWVEAEAAFKAALAEAERAFEPQDRRLAHTLYSLAIVYHKQARRDEAEPLYRRAVMIYEQHPGADQRRYGQTLHDLGYLYRQQGQDEQAETLLRRSLTVREVALDPADLDVGQSLYSLMNLYHQRHGWVEAELSARRALAIYEQVKGPDDQRVGWILHVLGHILDAQGQVADAEPLLRRGLAIAEKVFGPDHPEVAHELDDYATVLRKLGREIEAEQLTARARAIRARAPKSG
jgi:tetratricopeptide (TPR) repeat protein